MSSTSTPSFTSLIQPIPMQSTFFLPNVILDESNYPTWLFRMEAFLKSMRLFDFVDGSSLCPPKFILSGNDISILNPEYVKWKSKDQTLIHMLSQTLSPVAMIWAVGSVTAAHMWDNLKQRFASSNRQNILQMKSNLYELKKGSDSIDEYLDKVKAAKDTLATVGVYLDDDDVLVIVLRGLPSSFAVIKTVIRSQPVSLTLSEIRTLLKGAEYDINQEYKISMSSMTSGIVNTGSACSAKIGSCMVGSNGYKVQQTSDIVTNVNVNTQSISRPSITSNPFTSICLVPPVVTDATAKAPEVTMKNQIDAEANPNPGQVDKKVEGGTETEKFPKVTETNETETLKEETNENDAESGNKENCDSAGKKANAEEADEKEPTESEGEGKEAKKDNNGHGDSSPPSAIILNSFQQLSNNQNAFTRIARNGFSSPSFSFEGSAFASILLCCRLYGAFLDQLSSHWSISTSSSHDEFHNVRHFKGSMDISRQKHVQTDIHFSRKKIKERVSILQSINSKEQLKGQRSSEIFSFDIMTVCIIWFHPVKTKMVIRSVFCLYSTGIT